MFEAVCMDLKRSGLGNVTHKPVIQADDMVKLRTYFDAWHSNPLVLLQKVWFDLMMFCCRRGREGLRELSKTSYIVDTDGSGSTFIRKNGSEVTKNHRNDIEDSMGGVIYEEKDSNLCPVASYTYYVGKLHPNCDALFQRPKRNFGLQNVSESAWFENKPLGKNSLGDLMVKISKAAGLSKVYTNHSIRSTSITALSESGFEGRKIKTISKHKSLQSIESYANDTSLPEKKRISATLASTLYDSNSLNQNAVAIPQSAKSGQEAIDLNDIDFLDDSIMLDPQIDKILTEISSSQYNVKNNYCPDSMSNRSINIQNVSGGVFNFYVSK